MLALLLLSRMNAQSHRRKKANVEKPDTNKPVTDYCRTCLATEDLEAIFIDRETEQKRSNDLSLVTGLEIKRNDGLSQKMCSHCVDAFNAALQFRKTSRRAEKTLLDMLTGKPIKTKHKIRKAKPKNEDTVDFGYDIYGEDFQNDDDYDDVVVKAEKKAKRESGAARRKRALELGAAPYKCTTCDKEFRMKATYNAHMRFHTHYCVCETCGKRCRNNNQLQEHKRARHGLPRIHTCATCDYSSATKEALMIHERRHTGERPYVCDHCGATFHRRSNLVQHIAIHLPEKNFQCDMCPKRLKSRKFLQIHKHNAHTGRRYGYLCPLPQCARRFEKPNKCTVCNKWEKSKKRLNIHIYKVHKEHKYRYLCPRCPKTYKCPDHVRRHLVNHHDVPRGLQGPVQKYTVTSAAELNY